MQDKKHILLVAPYVTFPDEMGMNRFIYLANLLADEFDVTLVTSRYCHFLKNTVKIDRTWIMSMWCYWMSRAMKRTSA